MLFSRCIRVLRKVAAVSAITLTAAAVYPGLTSAARADGPGSGESRGDVLGWGDNSAGQVGDGTDINRTTPVRVCAPYSEAPCTRFLTDVTAVSAGHEFSSLGLIRDGSAVSWGSNQSGQLGDGTNNDSNVPVRVCAVGQTAPCTQYLTGLDAVAAGWGDGMAVAKDGRLVAWGDNIDGKLGDGTLTERRTPVRVCAVGEQAPCRHFLDDIRQVSPGASFTLAVEKDGTALAWGWNGKGQLGDGTTDQSLVPERVCAVGEAAPCTHHLSGVKSVAAGLFNSTALLDDGSVIAWGHNGNGELGDGTFADAHTPVRVCAIGQTAPCRKYLTGVTAIASTDTFTFALLADGTVAAWGWNLGGELGNGRFGESQPVPVQVCAIGEHAPCTRFLNGVKQIATGAGGLAVRGDGTAVTWGGNADGRLGDGTTTDSLTPVQVCAPGQAAPCRGVLRDIRGISGEAQSLAVLTGG